MVGSTSKATRWGAFRELFVIVRLFFMSSTDAEPPVTVTIARVTKDTPSGSGLVKVTTSLPPAAREMTWGGSDSRDAARLGPNSPFFTS